MKLWIFSIQIGSNGETNGIVGFVAHVPTTILRGHSYNVVRHRREIRTIEAFNVLIAVVPMPDGASNM